MVLQLTLLTSTINKLLSDSDTIVMMRNSATDSRWHLYLVCKPVVKKLVLPTLKTGLSPWLVKFTTEKEIEKMKTWIYTLSHVTLNWNWIVACSCICTYRDKIHFCADKIHVCTNWFRWHLRLEENTHRYLYFSPHPYLKYF